MNINNQKSQNANTDKAAIRASFIRNPFNHSIIENQVKAGREGEARRYNATVNKIDFPSSLLAEILPLCAFTIAYTTESPIPKPPVLELWEASIR